MPSYDDHRGAVTDLRHSSCNLGKRLLSYAISACTLPRPPPVSPLILHYLISNMPSAASTSCSSALPPASVAGTRKESAPSATQGTIRTIATASSRIVTQCLSAVHVTLSTGPENPYDDLDKVK